LRSTLQRVALTAVITISAPAVGLAQSGVRQIDGFFGVGLHGSTRDLGVISLTEGVAQRQFTTGLNTGATLVGGLAVPLQTDRASLRTFVSYSSLAVETYDEICDRDIINCGDLLPAQSDATVLGFGATVLLHASGGGSPIRPYFLVGGSLKAYRFDATGCRTDAESCQARDLFLEDQTRPNLNVGIGAFAGRGRLRAFIELQAGVGTFESSYAQARGETQNDLRLAVGLNIPLLTR
jgi:hypothetical protein